MTVDKIIYDHLLCESRTIERAIYKMYVPGIISIDGTNISIHKVLPSKPKFNCSEVSHFKSSLPRVEGAAPWV